MCITRAMGNIAYIYLQLGNYKRSLELYRESCSKNIKIFEQSHEECLDEFSQHAIQLSEQGKCVKAFFLFLEIYKSRRVLEIGDEHRIMLCARTNLSLLYKKLKAMRFIQRC